MPRMSPHPQTVASASSGIDLKRSGRLYKRLLRLAWLSNVPYTSRPLSGLVTHCPWKENASRDAGPTPKDLSLIFMSMCWGLRAGSGHSRTGIASVLPLGAMSFQCPLIHTADDLASFL